MFWALEKKVLPSKKYAFKEGFITHIEMPLMSMKENNANVMKWNTRRQYRVARLLRKRKKKWSVICPLALLQRVGNEPQTKTVRPLRVILRGIALSLNRATLKVLKVPSLTYSFTRRSRLLVKMISVGGAWLDRARSPHYVLARKTATKLWLGTSKSNL